MSKADKPVSLGSSVTLSLKAFFAPVLELTIKEKVPSPLSVTVALTPSIAVRASAKPTSVLLESEIDNDCDVCVASAVNVPPSLLQEPKSIFIVPLFIAAALLENPENSRVCEEAS